MGERKNAPWDKKLHWVVLSGLLLSAATANAANYYVAPNGLDTNAGTSTSSPLKTPTAALAKAQPGDTVYVRAGDYLEETKFARGGQPGKPITLRNFQGEKPKLGWVNIGNKSWITVVGLEIIGSQTVRSAGISFGNVNNITIRGNYLNGTPASAILGHGRYINILNNTMLRSGGYGMYLTGQDFLIANNLVIESNGFGLHVAGYPLDCNDYHGGDSCGHWNITEEQYSGARRFKIFNNVFALSKKKSGLVLWLPGTTDSLIKNNIFYRNGESVGAITGIEFVESPGNGHVIENNLFFRGPGNAAAYIEPNNTSRYTESGSKVGDPLFKNVAAYDFHLTANSPAINAGLNLYSQGIVDDFAGVSRPSTGPFDIGAYEFGGAVVDKGRPNAPTELQVR